MDSRWIDFDSDDENTHIDIYGHNWFEILRDSNDDINRWDFVRQASIKMNTSIPSNKPELLSAIQMRYQKLLKELKTIPEDQSRHRIIEGDISICDIMAYQIGWGNLLIGWHLTEKEGGTPLLPKKGYLWTQLGRLAHHFYDEYATQSFEELNTLFEKTVTHIISIIEGLSEDDLYKIGRYRWCGTKWPLGRWVSVNTAAPYKSACAKIRQWKRLNKQRIIK